MSDSFELTKHVRVQGLSTFTISDDLVVYGGDKSGLTVCTMAGSDWKWTNPAITGMPKFSSPQLAEGPCLLS